MDFDDIRRAVYQAKNELRAVDNNADVMADLLKGRLRHVHSWKLKALKKELRDFNMHTGEWMR